MQAEISVIGHFAEGLNLLNGQTVKTKIITDELCRQFGEEQVLKFDTFGGKKTLLKAPFQVFKALKNSKNVLIFPAHNGLRVYAPLLAAQKWLFQDRRLHYVVIGGWLPQFLTRRKTLSKMLQSFDGVYVETNTMKCALEAQGFANVYVMPNCKKLIKLFESDLVYPERRPFKLCTFSRVMKEKGIETAVNAVTEVNEQLGYAAYSLDIYGQIDAAQEEWFDALKEKFPEYIHYCGCVQADKSTDVLKDYFALLFPSHFYTEGIPGTIIDAYAAGVPVISAKWESYSDIIDEGKTGIGYGFDDEEALRKVLSDLTVDSKPFLAMKKCCLNKAEAYTPETAIQVLVNRMMSP